MNKMNPNRSNKDSGATEVSNAKKGLQMDSDSSEQPKDYYDGSDENEDTSQNEESDLSSGSSQDSTTQSSEDSDSSSGSSQDSPAPEIPIPEALLKVDPNDQQSVVNAVGLLVNRINSQLDAIQSKVCPKSPLDFVGLVRQKKLWKLRQRDKAQMDKSSE
ncbi:uncharacterized protein LOC6736714 [Drosophila simulans]|uniref:Uncharacterized protein, isoform B n=1 Tax=Drosophila simulans TaxID=7240 RepID=A0A0J9RNH9_DROSI|nr:uncharacterized protein LOC6736714 [Drosophila simulans]XP_016030325.1 uncharacterized protein LOC6736714 [Drosophila simulans]KMY97481.1 uncharacterized protein Dsimw501_GD13809, isoform B [Drosophila simulans]KMY97482.1 uncharacterized protein Dsimw501_GD13809, isoform C [Drosophila simulans]